MTLVYIFFFTFPAVCCLILGRRMGYLGARGNESSEFSELITAVRKLFIIERDSYYGVQLWKYIPTKLYRDFAKNEEIVYNIVSKIVDQSLEEELEQSESDNDVRSIFLTILQNDQLDIRDKKSGIIDALTSGIQTVSENQKNLTPDKLRIIVLFSFFQLSNTLSFLIYHLTQNKESQEKIQKEFINCDRHLTADDIFNATYTKACMQESYRISPVAFCIARILEQDYTLSGYNLKAGVSANSVINVGDNFFKTFKIFCCCHFRLSCYARQ
jgi:ecdysone 20-monooxygenase